MNPEDRDTALQAPARVAVARITGTFTRKEVEDEVDRAVEERPRDVREPTDDERRYYVDLIVAQGRHSARNAWIMAGTIALFAVVFLSLVLNRGLVFEGLGLSVGVTGETPDATGAPDAP